MTGPILITERLILRPPNKDDFEPYAAFMADPEAAQFLGGQSPPSVTWRNLASLIGGWEISGFGMFTYIDKQTGEWVGRGGPWSPEGWPGKEVGWAVSPKFQRKGFAKEAATACIDYAFDHLGWTEVIHCIDAKNAPSIAVAKSLGSYVRRSNVSAPAPIVATWDLYGQTREEWRARKQR